MLPLKQSARLDDSLNDPNASADELKYPEFEVHLNKEKKSSAPKIETGSDFQTIEHQDMN